MIVFGFQTGRSVEFLIVFLINIYVMSKPVMCKPIVKSTFIYYVLKILPTVSLAFCLAIWNISKRKLMFRKWTSDSRNFSDIKLKRNKRISGIIKLKKLQSVKNAGFALHRNRFFVNLRVKKTSAKYFPLYLSVDKIF